MQFEKSGKRAHVSQAFMPKRPSREPPKGNQSLPEMRGGKTIALVRTRPKVRISVKPA